MTVTSNVLQVGQELVDLCRAGKNMEAIERLYSDKIESVEAVSEQDAGEMGRVMKGKDAVRGKSEWWYANHEVHGGEVQGPFPHGNRFAVFFKYDITAKESGQRMTIEEVGLYTVDGDQIVKEEFFYHMG